MWPAKFVPCVQFFEVEEIHRRRFPSSDPQRFLELWCQVAAICGKAPEDLHENEPIVTVPPEELFLNDRVEDLLQLTLRESRGVPTSKIENIGELMEFMLGVSPSRPTCFELLFSKLRS